MKILTVFNNNVVLARDESGDEIVLTGRGLGFQKKPGEDIDPSRIVRSFSPTVESDARGLAEYIAQIPPEHIALAAEALDLARSALGLELGTGVVVALADHLSFAITRIRRELPPMEYPVQAEVAHLYAGEFRVARQIIEFVNSRIDVVLPQAEAVPVTLHLVNAGFSTTDLSRTFQMTDLLTQIFEVVEGAYNIRINAEGISAARFITHLRYFFIRMEQDVQEMSGSSELAEALRKLHPEAHNCALRIQNILELRLGKTVTSEEVGYLTLHIARLALEATSPREQEIRT